MAGILTELFFLKCMCGQIFKLEEWWLALKFAQILVQACIYKLAYPFFSQINKHWIKWKKISLRLCWIIQDKGRNFLVLCNECEYRIPSSVHLSDGITIFLIRRKIDEWPQLPFAFSKLSKFFLSYSLAEKKNSNAIKNDALWMNKLIFLFNN